MEILDREPEKLLSIHGISEAKLDKICESYLANRAASDVIAFLVPHGITVNRAIKLYREYGSKTMEIVKEHPYTLCEMAGVGFFTADKIAKSMGFDELSTDRVDAGILYTLTDAESRGHLCMEKYEFAKACLKLLQTPALTEEMIGNRAQRLVYDRKLICYHGMVYRYGTGIAEASLAALVAGRINQSELFEIPTSNLN